MDKIIILGGSVLGMIFIVFIGYVLAYLFTETKVKLPLNFKPFNCCPCLSFWLSFLLNVVYTGIISSYFAVKAVIAPQDCNIVMWMFLCIAFFMSLTAFFIVKNKYKIYE